MVSQLKHPHIVGVYRHGACAAGDFLVLEYVEGPTLGTWFHTVAEEQGGLENASYRREVAACGHQIANALAYIHSHRLIHRDLKPANCIRQPDGTVKLLDFGIVKSMEIDTLGQITAQGKVLGTANYMSPEQIRGRRVDPRADLYSLGCVLFRLYTGRLPYRGDSLYLLLKSHLEAPIPDPVRLNPGLAPEEVELIRVLMAKRPADRYQSALEVAEELESLELDRREELGEAPAPAPGASQRVPTPSPSAAHGHPYLLDPGTIGRESELRRLVEIFEDMAQGGRAPRPHGRGRPRHGKARAHQRLLR